MLLLIDTASPDKLSVALWDGKKIAAKAQSDAKYGHHYSEKLLPAIDGMLERSGVALKDLEGVVAATGPGAFTSLRIGVITANTLSFALDIPVAGARLNEFESLDGLAKIGAERLRRAKSGKIIMPHYGKEPNITVKGD